MTYIYWNLVIKCGIKQYNKGKESGIEKILYEEMKNKLHMDYKGISDKKMNDIKKKVNKIFKKYALGSLYYDTEGKFYGFSKKNNIVIYKDEFKNFILQNNEYLLKRNNQAWIGFMRKYNKKINNYKLLEVLEGI